MSFPSARTISGHQLADHSADARMIFLSLLAPVVGTGGAFGAWVLIKSIAIATNAFWFGRISAEAAEISDAAVGLAVVAVPVIGSLIIGLMARFGSEKIRGHGIPEAIETILYGESRLSLKVAILKPISAAISIGSGGGIHCIDPSNWFISVYLITALKIPPSLPPNWDHCDGLTLVCDRSFFRPVILELGCISEVERSGRP